MNCRKLLDSYLSQKLCLKSLIFLAVLLFFFPQNSFALQDCAVLPSGTDANPGVNCDYFGLPRCNTVTTPNPRVNCADLIHLPLDIDLSDQGATVEVGKNAVTECKNVTAPATAVHNGNCIRFCDAPEAGITANPGVNCVERKCYQVAFGVTPVESGGSKNCAITSCKYLTNYELNDPKFDDSNKKYCDGQLKCYQFEQDKLQFLKVRQTNTMCLLHNCKPPVSECGADDSLNVSNKGSAYKAEYESKILSGFSLESNSICAQIVCKPVFYRSYYCENGVANPSCDSSCVNNYCQKKIDCNLASNSGEQECGNGSPINTDEIVDIFDAWFYRPAPPKKATTKDASTGKLAFYDDENTKSGPNYYLPINDRTSDSAVIGEDRICYTQTQLEFNGSIVKGDGFYVPVCDSDSCPQPANACRGSNYCIKYSQRTDSWWGQRAGTYFHSNYLPDHSRSPGLCDLPTGSSSGVGNYLYLCGNHFSLYGTPSNPAASNLEDFTGYQRGYVRSDFTKSNPEHKINFCLRYKNLLAFDEESDGQTCGKRECTISCGFDWCSNQYCGKDECVDLTITENEPTKCAMSDDLFNGGEESDYKCMRYMGPYSRVRAVRIMNNVCTFLDSKGILAYDYKYDKVFEASKDANGNYEECDNGSYPIDMKDNQGGLIYDEAGNVKKGCQFEFYFNFLGGNEKFDDGSCVSGQKNDQGVCVGGFNTNQTPGSASVWRTHKFKTYNSYNTNGSLKYIEENGDKVGISLSPVIPYIARTYEDLSGKVFNKQQCAKVPLRVDSVRLYNLANGANSPKLFIPPLFIANARLKQGGSVVLPQGGNQFGKTDFHNPEIEIKFGTESKLLSLSPLAEESVPVTLSATVASLNYNIDVFVKKLYDESSKKPILCLYRVVNDSNGMPLPPVQVDCVERERPEIDNKRGLLGSINQNKQTKAVLVTANSDLSYNDFEISLRYLIDPGANKLNNKCSSDDVCSPALTLTASADSLTCEQSLEKYKVCVQREECSKLNIECINNERNLYNALNGNPNPQAGTVAQMESIRNNCNTVLLPFCNSKKGLSSSGDVISQDYNNPSSGNYYGWFNELCFVTGFETKLRQIYAYDLNGVKGKCLIDETSPYLTDNDPDTNCDEGGKAPNCLCLEFALGSSDEVDSGQVVRRETPREAGLCIDIPVPQVCKAVDYNTLSADNEFVGSSITNSITNYPTEIYNNSTGVHTTHRDRSQDTLISGHAEFPNAIIGMTNVIGQCKGFWKSDIDSVTGILKKPLADCANDGSGIIKWTNFRNSCIRYSCPAVTTSIPDASGNYSNNYDADDRDQSDMEKRGETHGYAIWPTKTKTNDFLELATATSCIVGFKKDGSNAVTNGSGVITSYSGGTNPSRLCNQTGFWLPPINVCQRISCSAVNPAMPSNSGDLAAWQQWQKSGGATFPSVKASRSNIAILPSAIATGTCKAELGFFQTSGGLPPTRTCDHLGNWSTVQNPCVTECDQITATMAQNDANSGYATWAKVTVTSAQYGQSINGVFGSCISGYKINPYLGNPQRQCLPQPISGQPGRYSYVWNAASNSCINKCQGGASDPENGKTIHATSGGNITITWPDADFNQYVYVSNRSNLTTLTADHFRPDRSNGDYLVRRKCNDNGSWSAPEVMCATNGGAIENATYGTNASTETIAVGNVVGGNTVVNGVCSSGFTPDNDNVNDVPVRQCKYKDSNNKIDEVFLDLVSGSQCVRTCQINNGFSTGNAVYSGSDVILRENQTVNLSCNSGFGRRIIGGARTSNNTGQTCGRASTDRSNDPPIARCQNGNMVAENDCQSCRNCNNSSAITGTTTCHMDSTLTCAGTPRGIVEDVCLNTPCNQQVTIDLSNVGHNGIRSNRIELSEYLSCSVFTARACARITVQCVDNQYQSSAVCDANAVNNKKNDDYSDCP